MAPKALILLIGWLSATTAAVCPAQGQVKGPVVHADTTRPPIPNAINLPADSTFTLEVPHYPRSEVLYYSNIVGISFEDSASGTTIRRLIASLKAVIIGGYEGAAGLQEYVVRLDTPVRSMAAFDSLLTAIALSPGVRRANRVYYRTPVSVH